MRMVVGVMVLGQLLTRILLAAHAGDRLAAARRILKDVPLIDGHNDLPWNIRKFLKNQLREFRFDDLSDIHPWSRSAWSHTDLKRLRQGMVAAQFWSAYVPCSSQHLDSVQLALEQIDLIRRLVNKHADSMVLVTTAEGIERAHKEARLASLIGVEGGHAVGASLAVLRMLYELGARADCSTADEPGQVPQIGGLSNFGKSVVLEMNRLGMMVDLSHVSVPTMLAAMTTSRAPVIFSHSSAHALCNSSRNVPDHALRLLAQTGGIVMVSFYPHFISCGEKSTLEDVAAHINHVRKIAGVDHVGIGAGYDGINLTPTGLEDVSKYPELFAELLAHGWSEKDIQKLAGLNLIRVFKAVEQIRDNLAAEGMEPLEEEIPQEDIIGRDYCRYNIKRPMTP
ncbi:PREDICTED: dipeptidase 1 isoform X3 [Acromyrmex echinatior]|uniref:dipeptidase 1 isoform X3 n=1 Tax=Acromyrmex echinatior TaxID=103372 RepID=UPI000580C2B2|nr:PREDICTED: dipeptidase 1 isoform X3 [Acromyrmex echinatior]